MESWRKRTGKNNRFDRHLPIQHGRYPKVDLESRLFFEIDTLFAARSVWLSQSCLHRTRAPLIRTYGTVNDRRRLLCETTAVFPEVLSAVMDVATAMSSATLVEFCCNACLAHRLVTWLAHFRCSLQATWKESVQAPEKSTLRCCVPIKLP